MCGRLSKTVSIEVGASPDIVIILHSLNILHGHIIIFDMKEILLFKIGSHDRPATQDEIDNFSDELRATLESGASILVTHERVVAEILHLEDDFIPRVKASGSCGCGCGCKEDGGPTEN